jgi:hypothetical protein
MMPIEYLEKIFQIPFAMPEMAEDGYRKLIASLAPSALTPQPGETVLSAPDPPPRADEPPGGDRAPVRALLPVQPGSSASGEEPVNLTLAEEDNPAGKGISGWPDFVAALNPRATTGPGPLVPADLAGQPSSAVAQAEAAEWASLYRALVTTCQQNVLPDLTSYQAWGPLAARFSFTL